MAVLDAAARGGRRAGRGARCDRARRRWSRRSPDDFGRRHRRRRPAAGGGRPGRQPHRRLRGRLARPALLTRRPPLTPPTTGGPADIDCARGRADPGGRHRARARAGRHRRDRPAARHPQAGRRRRLQGPVPLPRREVPVVPRAARRKGFHCFGCGEGGDVISFLMKHDGLASAEAVEHLADKYRRPAALRPRATPAPRRDGAHSARRLVEAHKRRPGVLRRAAGRRPTPRWPRQFLAERGFDQDAAEHLRRSASRPATARRSTSTCARSSSPTRSWSPAGSSAQGQRGHYDRFRGRLLWPIRETSGETIGFGARRIFDDDRIEAKYLNTPETPIYKKSHVLYGIDLARARDRARPRRRSSSRATPT